MVLMYNKMMQTVFNALEERLKKMKEIEELYEKYGKKIYNYFYYLTYDACKADDLTQETFYQAIISIVKFKGKSAISTWLYSIARNVFLKSIRKEKRDIVGYDDNILINMMTDAECSPEEMVIKKDTINMVRVAIRSLSEQYATVLILRDKEGLSYLEIAQITKMSEASVKVNIFRARKKFKEEYAKINNGTIENSKTSKNGGATN